LRVLSLPYISEIRLMEGELCNGRRIKAELARNMKKPQMSGK
jgi:hypothetical protein